MEVEAVGEDFGGDGAGEAIAGGNLELMEADTVWIECAPQLLVADRPLGVTSRE